MHTYDIGDRVRIVKTKDGTNRGLWDTSSDYSGCMREYFGKIVTITDCIQNSSIGNYYHIKEDDGYWGWFEDFIDGMACTNSCDKFKIKSN